MRHVHEKNPLAQPVMTGWEVSMAYGRYTVVASNGCKLRSLVATHPWTAAKFHKFEMMRLVDPAVL